MIELGDGSRALIERRPKGWCTRDHRLASGDRFELDNGMPYWLRLGEDGWWAADFGGGDTIRAVPFTAYPETPAPECHLELRDGVVTAYVTNLHELREAGVRCIRWSPSRRGIHPSWGREEPTYEIPLSDLHDGHLHLGAIE